MLAEGHSSKLLPGYVFGKANAEEMEAMRGYEMELAEQREALQAVLVAGKELEARRQQTLRGIRARLAIPTKYITVQLNFEDGTVTLCEPPDGQRKPNRKERRRLDVQDREKGLET